MAFRIKPGRPVTAEVHRVLQKQLRAAVRILRSTHGRAESNAIHAVRRRVKKTITAIHLIRRALTASPKATVRGLREIKRSLARVADAEAIVQTLDRLAACSPALTPQMRTTVRRRLIRIERRLEKSPATINACASAIRSLTGTAEAVAGWQFKASGFDALDAGLEQTYRRARRAMVRAEAAPNSRSYHAWRQRAKEHWLALRLVETRCNRRLMADQRQLEALDGFLGEHHNTSLLGELLMTRPLATREDTVRWLRALRRYRSDLRRKAGTLGAKIYAEKPREFVRRVHRAWKAGPLRQRPAHVEGPWPRAA